MPGSQGNPSELDRMVQRKGDIVELEIERLLPGGIGAVREGRMTYELRGALPGDVVRARIRRIKGSRILAETQDTISHAFPRVEPRCVHFGKCGGCTWQHIRYADQLRLKASFVKRCFEETVLLSGVHVGELLGCESPYFYRNKMEFSFGEVSGSNDEGQGNVGLGLHIRGKYDRIFNLTQCVLQSEGSNGLVEAVRRWANEHSLSAYDLRSHDGLLRFLMVREGKFTGESMVNLVVSQPGFCGQDEMAREMMEKHPQVTSFVLNVNDSKAQIATGKRQIVVAGKRTIREKIGDLMFDVSANSFFQTNTRQAGTLYDTVVELAELGGNEAAFDLYCGAGAIALHLSRHAKSILGVEVVEEAIRDARRNARLNAVSNCTFVRGEVEDVLADLRSRSTPEVVVVDPPRAGLHKRVIQALVGLSAPRIIYVSCNPESMARDVQALCIGRYRLEVLQPVDMFPHTHHVECVARLRRSR